MTTRATVIQLTRLLGKEEVYRRLGLDEEAELPELTADLAARLHALIDERLGELLFGLAVEAVASDDVTDAASAHAYLEDRLAFFGGLLTEGQKATIRQGFQRVVSRWG